MCPRRSRPCSAAKQGRSFRVTPINSSPNSIYLERTRILGSENGTLECSCVPKGVQAAFCSKTAPFLSCAPNKPSAGLWAQGGQGHVLQQNRAVLFRVTPINSAPTRFSRGSPDLRIRKWTLERSCVPKGVEAAFCSKTAPFLSCAPNKPSAGLWAQGGQGHVLQQNRAVLFV